MKQRRNNMTKLKYPTGGIYNIVKTILDTKREVSATKEPIDTILVIFDTILYIKNKMSE